MIFAQIITNYLYNLDVVHRKDYGNFEWIAGVDEVGRGPIAGPVTVGVCLCKKVDLAGLMNSHPMVQDSKTLSARKRERIVGTLKKDKHLVFAISSVGSEKIDQIGISECLRIAVGRSLAKLKIKQGKTLVLLDGSLYAPKKYQNQRTIIKGDQSEWLISAASIVAKVSRDKKMVNYSRVFPGYGFVHHKGYGTRGHYLALKKLGLTRIHRRAFLHKKSLN